MFSLSTFARSLVGMAASVIAISAMAEDAQVFTKWTVVVKDNILARECAVQVSQLTGYEVTQALDTIGILSVTSPTADGSLLSQVPCVDSYELDGIMTGNRL